MASLLNDRNKLLEGVNRVVGRTVSLSSGTATAFTVPKNSTTAIPSTIILTATSNKFISPTYTWSYRFGDVNNFTILPAATGTSHSVIGDANFVAAAADYTLVQYKVVVTETGGPPGIAEDTLSLYVFREGANSIAAQFSNSTVMVFSDSTGVVPTDLYAQLTSTLTIYNGTVDDSANWTVSLTNTPAGVTASIVGGKTVSISNITSTFTSGVIEVTASRQGYSNIVKELPVTKIADPEDAVTYDVEIQSTNGTAFRVGENRATLLKARVFKNDVEVTDILPSSAFRWIRQSMDPPVYPNLSDAQWNALYASGYKQISVNVDEVQAKATFTCEIAL